MLNQEFRADRSEEVVEMPLRVREEVQEGQEGFMSEPLVCTPLAMMRPEECGAIESFRTVEMQEEISLWVRRRVKGFGKFLGVTCSGFKDRILDLLMDIEKNRRSAEASSKQQQEV